MFLHDILKKHNRIEKTPESSKNASRGLSNALNFRKDLKRNQGFTMFELLIVIALLSIVIGLAAVGISGFFDAADQMERSEVAETSFYSIQSHVNYLKRKGELEKFEEQIKVYNQSIYGQTNILSEDQNRTIIEQNYEGGDPSAFYNDEYLPAHQESEIVYIPLDSSQSNRESNPLYPILSAALQNEDVMRNSFFVEYDLSTGVVRSVFYSESVPTLGYHFSSGASAANNGADCIYRDAKSLQEKKQGYYGITFTASEYALKALELMAPREVTLVNEDRLYLTWMEENNNNEAFSGGEYEIDELVYIITLYNQEDKEIAVYELARGDLYEEAAGTEDAVLNYIDDFSTPVEDTLVNSHKQARAGFVDLSYEEAPDGIAGEYYYLLLECLDHPFRENGYEFEPADTMYATVEVSYGEEAVSAEEIADSNEESVYYAHVEDTLGTEEFGIACNRHLWNIRNGKYDGAYRLIADVDWTNIEKRARTITFTSTQFEDESVAGLYHSFEGILNGEKTGEAAQGADYLYSNYEINGVSIAEEENENVGLFTVNMGTIENITLADFVVNGSAKTGALAGYNSGTMENICVLDVTVSAKREAGGLIGYNAGTVKGCTATTGINRIAGERFVGGLVGRSEGAVTDSQTACNVQFVLPEGTEKFTSNTLGRYIGGVIGYVNAGGTAQNLYSGVLLDTVTGMPLTDTDSSVDGNNIAGDNVVNYAVALGVAGDSQGEKESEEVAEILKKKVCSDVTGVAYVGGIIGDIETGAGEFENLYNYAKLNVSYISAEERSARSDVNTKIYNFYGGIVGNLYAGNSLKNCVNYAVVALDFLEDGQPCDDAEIYEYIKQRPDGDYYFNSPRYIGGIVGYSKGEVIDCLSLCTEYGTFEETLEEYKKVFNGEEGCYIGAYAGGLIGWNEGNLLFTSSLPTDTMQVVVKAFQMSNGGLVGHAKAGSIKNEKGMLTVQGVVVTRGSDAAQCQNTYNAVESTGGIVGKIAGGEFTGEYVNDASVIGKSVGGITAYLPSGYTIDNCNNTGTVLGRGMVFRHGIGAVGGIVGYNVGTVTNCTNTGIVSNTFDMKDTAKDSTFGGNFESYIGGVAGYNVGLIKNCHSKLNEEKSNYISSTSLAMIGGVVGYNSYDGTLQFGQVLTDREEIVDVPIYVGGCSYKNHNTKAGGIIGCPSGQLELKDFVYSGDMEIRYAFPSAQQGYGGIVGTLGSATQVISDCSMKGTITSLSRNTGGVVGYMTDGVIEETVKVTPEAIIDGGSYTGGIVGLHNVNSTTSHVDIMENVATVSGKSCVGGIAGAVEYGHSLDISNRKNSGKVTGAGDKTESVGGIVGRYKMGTLTQISGCENTGVIAGVSNVGGIIGTLWNNATIEDCTNKQTVTGGSKVGGILGFIGNGGGKLTVTINNCTNEKEAKIVADTTTGGAGGIVGGGYCNYYYTNNGLLTMSDCYNYGPIDAPYALGGMAGDMEYFGLAISDCHNYGSIGEFSEGLWQVKRAGGIIGDALAAKELEESLIKDCTQKANIYNAGGTAYTHGVGGICGNMDLNLRVENCPVGDKETVYCIEANGKAYSLGGIVGDGGKNLVVINCVSNVDISGTADTYFAGGIVGYSRSAVTIGEEGKPETYCDAYGDISAKTLLQSSGGILGSTYWVPFEIYGSTHYGDLGNNCAKVVNTGGIFGYAELSAGSAITQGVLADCTQLGQIYNASSCVGGIVGKILYHDITIRNCNNGSPSVAGSGRISSAYKSAASIGGLTGELGPWGTSNSVERTVVLQNSHNYADLYFENTATRIGGLVGHSSLSLIIGDEADATLTCYNYGDIDGGESVTFTNVGGIIGLGFNYVKSSTAHLYDVVNYGNIGRNVAGVSLVGGMIGQTVQNSHLANCTNLGQIKNIVGSQAGGLVGYAGGVTEFTLEQCVNGASDNAEAGVLEAKTSFLSIGGLIGRIGSDSKTLTGTWRIKDSVNYAQVTVDGAGYWIGGICGVKSTLADLYIENTVNYGDIVAKTGLVRLVGGILGYGSSGTVHIGAALEDGSTDTTKICVNYGELSFEESAIGNRVGGIVGQGTNTSVYGAVNEADITHDDTAKVAGVGGIGGYFGGTTLLQDCRQNAVIYYMQSAEASPSGRNPGAGGIASWMVGEATLLRCENGSQEARNAGELDGSIFADSVTSDKNSTYIGGLIGRSYADMHVEECYNYADLTLQSAVSTDIGGLCGVTGGEETFLSCNNYGNIITEGRLVSTGGLIGLVTNSSTSSEKVTHIGDANDATLACINYGNLVYGGEKESSYLGGIIGDIYKRPIEIYFSQNYGTIGADDADTPMTDYAGGMVGRSKGYGSSVISGCTQNAAIYRAYRYVGGMMGYVETETIISDCVNGSADNAQAGRIYGVDSASYIGGIAGWAHNLTVEGTKNYAELSGEAYIYSLGGIVGHGKNLIIGSEDATKGCVNYGNIHGTTRENVLGGILGSGTLSVSILNCTNEGNVGLGNGTTADSAMRIGGVAGMLGDTNVKDTFAIQIKNCTNNGDLLYGRTTDGTTLVYDAVGGIVASVYGGVDSSETLIENCINNGVIGTESFPGNGNYIGGIAGVCSGTIRDCTNNAIIYTGYSYIGGIAGTISNQTSIGNLDGCINNGDIKPAYRAEYVGGICGYSNAHNYNKEITIKTCKNTGTISLKADARNKYIGGIFGGSYRSNNRVVNIEISDCINEGVVANGYQAIGGIIGITAYFDKCVVLKCTNFGTIQAQDRIGNDISPNLGWIGGIAGVGDTGNFYGCINAGNISGNNASMGGLFGTSGNRSIVNCYNVGKVETPLITFSSIGDTIGYLTGAPYIVDCYSYTKTAGKQIGTESDTAVNRSFWQAASAGGMDGYLDEAAYATLCSLFGVSGTLDVSTPETLYTCAKLLTDNYKYNPDAPTAQNITYTPADTSVEGSVATISFDVNNMNYFASSGMEVYLYESTLTDEEILDDVTVSGGDSAFFATTVEFSDGQVSDIISIDFDDTLLPSEEDDAQTEVAYKVVIRTLGYMTSEGTVITEDTEASIQGEVTLPTVADDTPEEETVSLQMELAAQDTVSGGDSGPDEGSVSDDDSGPDEGSIADDDSETEDGSISDGDSKPEDISISDDDSVSGSDVLIIRREMRSNNVAA